MLHYRLVGFTARPPSRAPTGREPWRVEGAARAPVISAPHRRDQVNRLPFGGVVVDWAGARRVALASDAVSGLAQLSIGLLLLTGHLAIAPIAVAAAFGGAASAFGVPATLPNPAAQVGQT
jgi:hypothetical protein